MYRRPKDKKEAIQAIEGALLSDAGVYITKGCVNAHFIAKQSYKEHLDWLRYLKLCLNVLGISSSIRSVKAGGYRDGCFYLLRSKVHPWLTEQRRRWYPDGRKIVPPDIRLTASHIANWIAGDGSLLHGWPHNKVFRPGLRLCTLGFDDRSLKTLGMGLFRVGVKDVTRGSQKGRNGEWLTIGVDGTSKIRAAVLEYMPPSHMYKLPGRRVRNI